MLRIGINEKYQYYAHQIARDYNGDVIFLSYLAYQNYIEQSFRDLRKDGKLQLEGVNYKFFPLNEYTVKKYYDSSTDLTHVILLKKACFSSSSSSTFYMLVDIDHINYDLFYEKANIYSSLPLRKEWAKPLYHFLARNKRISAYRISNYSKTPNNVTNVIIQIDLSDEYLKAFISDGLKNNTLSFTDDSIKTSHLTSETNLSTYTQEYCEILADKISNSFTPVYNPTIHSASQALNDFEDYCYDQGRQGLQLYEAQKAIIMACSKNLNKEHISIVCGECGSGKSLMGAGISYVHGKQLGYTALVMCPAQLVSKWQREILRSVPNARCYIIKRIADIKRLENEIKEQNKTYNLYLIFSQESAKFDYNKRPSVRYSKIQKGFICPSCGKVLYKVINEKQRKKTVKRSVKMTSDDFAKESLRIGNITCSNIIDVYDTATGVFNHIPCNASLWTPVLKNDPNALWTKAGKAGWFYTEEMKSKHEELMNKEVLSKKEREALIKLDEVLTEGARVVAPVRYSLSKYLLKYYKKYFDYFICDEVHELLAQDSLKSNSFGDLVKVAKNTICLTGTLINGYASSLFYLLYRLIPRRMQMMGFQYTDVVKFMLRYGSSKETRDIETNSLKRVPMPGVSPLLFTDYLMDICAFISLDDVADGLPGYKEIPIDCYMDPNIRSSYDDIRQSYLDNTGFRSHEKSGKASSQYMQLLNMYPDQPYDMDEVINPENNEILYTPQNYQDAYNDKLEKTLDLIIDKVQKGEKVLLYYRWTNKTRIADVISERLKEYDIRCAELKTGTIAKDKREEWLIKHNNEIDVLMCNPKLVETGLDLFDYTTIIWYQLTDNILTMRQASRRSWRLGQQKDVEVYFMYYVDTVQETLLSLMSGKLQASLSVEGKCSEENLSTANSMEDITTQITNSLIKGIAHKVDISSFDKTKKIRNGESQHANYVTRYRKSREEIIYHEPLFTILGKCNSDIPKKCASSDEDMFFTLLYTGNILKLL